MAADFCVCSVFHYDINSPTLKFACFHTINPPTHTHKHTHTHTQIHTHVCVCARAHTHTHYLMVGFVREEQNNNTTQHRVYIGKRPNL